MPKSPNEMAQHFNAATGSLVMNDMRMFTNMFINGADRNQVLMKTMEHEDSGSSSLLKARTQAIERTQQGHQYLDRVVEEVT